MRAALIDYGSGNIASAAKALSRAAAQTSGHEIVVTADPDMIRKSERIILPGVGAFADCMRGLGAVPGMVEALNESVLRGGTPILGICVGMQLMAERGREFETVPGLGWITGDVVAIEPSDPGLKIPHMGWNELLPCAEHPVLTGLRAGTHTYFVHSYCLRPANASDCLAETDYGGRLAAAVGRDNLFGTQFHPEKSQMAGLRLIANFLRWRP